MINGKRNRSSKRGFRIVKALPPHFMYLYAPNYKFWNQRVTLFGANYWVMSTNSTNSNIYSICVVISETMTRTFPPIPPLPPGFFGPNLAWFPPFPSIPLFTPSVSWYRKPSQMYFYKNGESHFRVGMIIYTIYTYLNGKVGSNFDNSQVISTITTVKMVETVEMV